MLPPTVVARRGASPWFWVHVPHGEPAEVWIELEDGGRRHDIAQVDHWVDPMRIGGALIGEATYAVPSDLPAGYHALRARCGDTTATATLIVAPDRLELPAALERGRAWGFLTQLYAVRSRRSWGIGDLGDLADLAAWSGHELGAGFVLVNPLHAGSPASPIEPSPYLPASRRFANPLYLRLEAVPEAAYLGAARAEFDRLAEQGRALTDRGRHRPRRLLAAQAPGARAAVRASSSPPGGPPRWPPTASARRRGSASSPPGARWPRSTEGPWRSGRRRCATRDRRAWRPSGCGCRTRWSCTSGRSGGSMSSWPPPPPRRATPGWASGSCTTWRSGCDPDGADPWVLGDLLAGDCSVGAPPDAYTQAGPGLVAAALAPGSPRRGRLRALPGDAAHGAPARRRAARRPCAGAVPALVGARGAVADRGRVRPVRPRGADRHPAARGRARGRRGDRRRPRDRRALGARLPARARGLRHLGAVVRARLVRRGAAPRALARAVPGLGHDARPAADRGLPGRGPRRAARLAGPAGARGRGGAGRRTRPMSPSGPRCSWSSGCCARAPASGRSSRRCTGSWSARRHGCSASRCPTRSATGAR